LPIPLHKHAIVWVPPDRGAEHGPFAARFEAAGGAKSSLRFAKLLDRRGPIGRGCLWSPWRGSWHGQATSRPSPHLTP